MANSEEKEKMAVFQVGVTSKSQSQAVFIEAVVIPEINVVLQRHADNLKELGKEI